MSDVGVPIISLTHYQHRNTPPISDNAAVVSRPAPRATAYASVPLPRRHATRRSSLCRPPPPRGL